MKMDSDALKFSPQVMALAMPQESGFTKGAEGITGLGKVFQDQEDRKATSALNALKMEEANQSIIGKTNENMAFEGEQTRKAETHRELQRKVSLEFDMLDRKNKGEIKSLEESGVMDQLSGQIKTPDFFDGKVINIEGFNTSRVLTLKDPRMAGKEHIVNAMYDKKLKEMNDLLEGTLKNGKALADTNKLVADTNETNEKTKWIGPKNRADINQSNSAAVASIAAGNYNNTRASLAPKELQLDQSKHELNKTTEGRLGKEGKTNAFKERLDLAKIFAGEATEIDALIPGYSKLNPTTQLYTQQRVLKERIFPKVVPTTSEESDKFGGDATHKVVWENMSKKVPSKVEVKVGEIKTNNSTGQKAQWDGHGWVLVK